MKKIVSIIDDDRDMGQVYKMILDPLVVRGEVAINYFSDPRDFIPWFGQNRPDLILTDASMPFLSGSDLCHLIKDSGQDIPTFFISGYDCREFRPDLAGCKITHFFTKPLDFDHLLQMVQSHLGISSSNTWS